MLHSADSKSACIQYVFMVHSICKSLPQIILRK